MRRTVLIAAAAVLALSALPASARSRGLAFDLHGKSWLKPGSGVQTGYGRDYAMARQFGGAPVNGNYGRGRENLPAMPAGPLFSFPFLGANAR